MGRGCGAEAIPTSIWSFCGASGIKRSLAMARRRNPVPKAMRGAEVSSPDHGGFEVWVSEEDLPLAKWILGSAREEFEKNPPEERTLNKEERELSSGTTGICPLCFGEFTTPSGYCPNCGVPLRLPQPERPVENSARLLCNIGHPRFIADLRAALKAAGIAFNNSNFSSGDIVSGRYYIPNYDVLVLEEDFGRATRVMSQVLQNWEFEPSAGFGIGNMRDPLADYWPERAKQNGWFPEDLSALVWSSENMGLVGGIGLALQEHEIPYRVETEQSRTARVFSHPEDEGRARELVREVVEGAPPE